MITKHHLINLLNFFQGSPRIGHTTAALDGVNSTAKARLICLNKDHATSFQKNYPMSGAIPLTLSSSFLAARFPAVLDNDAVEGILKHTLNEHKKNEDAQLDIEFLAFRSMKERIAGHTVAQRETGISSDSIVGIAYGLIEPDNQRLPGDENDLASCERMWANLPEHRKNGEAREAMKNARNYKKLQA